MHIADLSKLQSYVERHPFVAAAVELGGFRTALAVPMLKDSKLVGSINIFRQEVRPFAENRSSSSKISLPKPSSPSRTRDCSTSCVNRCNSRRPRPTYSRSSQARLVNWLLCSKQF